jgi:hypothetical protein
MHENNHAGPVSLLLAVGWEGQGRVQNDFHVRKGLIDLRRSIEKAFNDV